MVGAVTIKAQPGKDLPLGKLGDHLQMRLIGSIGMQWRHHQQSGAGWQPGKIGQMQYRRGFGATHIGRT